MYSVMRQYELVSSASRIIEKYILRNAQHRAAESLYVETCEKDKDASPRAAAHCV